jgi:hypothetical protein
MASRIFVIRSFLTGRMTRPASPSLPQIPPADLHIPILVKRHRRGSRSTMLSNRALPEVMGRDTSLVDWPLRKWQLEHAKAWTQSAGLADLDPELHGLAIA